MLAVVIIIDVLVAGTLLFVAARKGVEGALPAFTFFAILVPVSNQIKIPGLLGITTQRLAIIILALAFVIFRRSHGEQTEPRPRVPLPLKFLIAFQVVWCIVSTAHSIDPAASVKKMLAEVVEYYLVYFIFFRAIRSTDTIHKVLRAFVLAMIIVSAFGAVEAYTNWRIADIFPDYGSHFIGIGGDEQTGRGSRIESTFPHPILFGAGIAIALPIALYLASLEREVMNKKLLWAGILIMFLSLYKSQSRGPWLAAILSFLMLVPWGGKKIRKYMVAIAFLCFAVMVIRPGVYDTIASMYDATMDPQSPMGSSYEYRYALKDVAEKALARSTGRRLWGFGMESFYDLHLTGPFLGKADHPFLSCDSAWIEMMVETGYVGLLLFALILFSAALRALRGAFRLPEDRGRLSWIFFVCMTSYYFMMASVAMYAWGQNGYMLWIIIALSFSLATLPAEPAPVAALETTGDLVGARSGVRTPKRQPQPRLA